MNKKLIFIVGLAAVLVASLAFAGFAFAQTPTPPGGNGYGYGMMRGGNGYGRMGGGNGYGMRGNWSGTYGPMHDEMYDALAQGLDLTRAELDSRVAAGETPAQTAASKGISQADFAKIFTDARKAAMDQAVADGYLTQAQADRMLSHMGGRRGVGNGHCPFYGAGTTTNP